MFVVADIIARNERRKGKNVFFPVASHYSGNSAQNISKAFGKISSEAGHLNNEEKKLFNLYKNVYKTPNSILKTFADSLNILEFYNREILWELKSLDISCDYDNFYTTGRDDFSTFVNTIISIYKQNNLLVNNKKGEIALDYDNEKWREEALELLNSTEFLQPFHKNNVKSAIKNVRSDWSLLRENGFGVNYKMGTVDPMFDSEIFTIFDLYIKFSNEGDVKVDVKYFFRSLFKALKHEKKSKDLLINKIVNFLPCDTLICEEHLKTWVVKKMFAESLLFGKKYQTKKYFILGMGFLDGQQMSASKGHAILVKDLIDQYGPIKARLIILLGGGHPSKMYNYDKALPAQADKLLGGFINHYQLLSSVTSKYIHEDDTEKEKLKIKLICSDIEDNIEKGYYRQVVITLLSILPKEYYKFPCINTARILLAIYKEYINIMFPGLLGELDNHEKIHSKNYKLL